ncbi:hypothetical protein [Candidatus Nitrosocosmicus sp. SS]|jgi:predicted CopG family antitoxin|nr:hypothetical protein [Candidatus Nitrosocosmicus sp. SS]
MRIGNKRYKQILIDSDNYEILKEMGKTGDTFNLIIGKLVKNFKDGGNQ